MSSPEFKFAQAKAMVDRLNCVQAQAGAEDVDITRLSWDEFFKRVVASFKEGTETRRLMEFALHDAKTLAQRSYMHLENKRPGEAAALLQDNVASLLYPAHASQDGFHFFTDHSTNLKPKRGEDMMIDVYEKEGQQTAAEWTNDLEDYMMSRGGCPAFRLPISSEFPMSEVEGHPNPNNFLEQFFHVAVTVALNDPEVIKVEPNPQNV